MKIWRAFSSEHSARLKIIGVFETIADARHAAQLLNCIAGDSSLPEPLSSFLQELKTKQHLTGIQLSEIARMNLSRPIIAAGTEIRMECEGTGSEALFKVLNHYRARVRVVQREDC